MNSPHIEKISTAVPTCRALLEFKEFGKWGVSYNPCFFVTFSNRNPRELRQDESHYKVFKLLLSMTFLTIKCEQGTPNNLQISHIWLWLTVGAIHIWMSGKFLVCPRLEAIPPGSWRSKKHLRQEILCPMICRSSHASKPVDEDLLGQRWNKFLLE